MQMTQPRLGSPAVLFNQDALRAEMEAASHQRRKTTHLVITNHTTHSVTTTCEPLALIIEP